MFKFFLLLFFCLASSQAPAIVLECKQNHTIEFNEKALLPSLLGSVAKKDTLPDRQSDIIPKFINPNGFMSSLAGLILRGHVLNQSEHQKIDLLAGSTGNRSPPTFC